MTKAISVNNKFGKIFGAVAISLGNGLVGTEFASRYRLHLVGVRPNG